MSPQGNITGGTGKMDNRLRSGTIVSDVTNSTHSPVRRRTFSQNTTSLNSNSEQSSPLRRNTRLDTMDSSAPSRFNSAHLTGMEIKTVSSKYTAMRAREGTLAAVKNAITLQAQQQARRKSNMQELSLVINAQHSAGKASPTHMEGMRRRSSVLSPVNGRRRPSSAIDFGMGRRQSVRLGGLGGLREGMAVATGAHGSRRPSTAGAAGSRRPSAALPNSAANGEGYGGEEITRVRRRSSGAKSMMRPKTAEVGGGRPQSAKKAVGRPQSAKKVNERRMGPRTNAHREKALVDYHTGSAVQLLRKQKSESAREGQI